MADDSDFIPGPTPVPWAVRLRERWAQLEAGQAASLSGFGQDLDAGLAALDADCASRDDAWEFALAEWASQIPTRETVYGLRARRSGGDFRFF